MSRVAKNPIKLPKGVESIELSHGEEHDQPVVSIIKPRGMAADDAEATGEADASEE